MLKRFITLSIAAFTVFMIGCQKEPTNGNVPGGAGGGNPAGDALTKVAEDMGKNMGELMTSEGFVSIMAVSGKIKNSDAFNFGGFGSNKSNRSASVLKKLSNTVKSSLVRAAIPRIVAYKYSDNFNQSKLNKSGDDEDSLRFNFSEHTGIYKYNENTEEWEQIGSSSYIVFQMDVDVPDPQDTSIHYTKTAELTIYYWNEQRFSSWDEETNEEKVTYMPTGIKIDLKLEGAIVAAFDYACTFHSATMMPLNLSMTLNLAPFAVNANYVDGGQNLTGSMSLTKSGANMIGFGASIDFFNRSAGAMINVDEDDDIDDTQIRTLTAWVQVSTLKITVSANIEAMGNISDPTPDQINDNFSITITNNGQLIGSAEFYEDPDCQTDTCDVLVRIKFEDGSTGDIDEYFGDIIGQIDSLFGDEEEDPDSMTRVMNYRPLRR